MECFSHTLSLEEEQIVTNSSFIDMNNKSILPEEKLHHSNYNDGTLIPQSDTDTDLTFNAVLFLQQVFLKHGETLVPENFLSLTVKIRSILKRIQPYEVMDLKGRLKGHIGIYEDGYPWLDFEAASQLELHPDLWRPNVPQPPLPCPALNHKVKEALLNGRYVPMQHILHSLTLSRFNPEIEDYPLAFTQAVPLEFIGKIKKSDVIRGANVHALVLGSKFPLLAVRLPGIIDELWHFMFPNRFPAMAGIELYNEFFFDVSRQLGNCVIPPMDHIHESISSKVAEKYVPELQIHSI